VGSGRLSALRLFVAIGLVVPALGASACDAASSGSHRQAAAATPDTSQSPNGGGGGHPRLGGLPLSAGTFAYSVLGSHVVATAHRVPRAAVGQGPITVVVFDQHYLRLVLHGGSAEPAPGVAWRYGPSVRRTERRLLVGAFNSGFKTADARGGWVSEGRTVVPLVTGAASVVIYADGHTDIGRWGRGLPAAGSPVRSVRQNLQLLVDHGHARHVHPSGQQQLNRRWGQAFLNAPLISRSALAITRTGQLVWAAGTNVTVSALAHAVIAYGAVRALELDINAPLVRGYLYPFDARLYRRSRLLHRVLPLVRGQTQLRHDPGARNPNIAPHCTYLTVCTRDFFTILAR
jgi:hypothetical protein